MTQQFDFSNIQDLGKFWDGSKNAANAGGGKFNAYSAGISNRSNNLDLLYQNLLGRNTDSAGKSYWDEQLKSGAATYQTVADAIKGSDEYIGQQDYLSNNPDATADDLRGLDTAYVNPFHSWSGAATAGWKPPGEEGGSKLTQAQAESASSHYADQVNTTMGGVKDSVADYLTNFNWGSGANPFSSTPTMGDKYEKYDDSALREQIAGLRTAFDNYKTQSANDMNNMWNNYNWGYNQKVGGVRTQNELPGWAPKKGGTSGFFGRGGRSGKGLTTGALNLS